MPAGKDSKNIYGVRLNIELGCQLSIQVENMKERLTSYLVGMVPKSYIIIKTPLVAGAIDLLSKGNSVTIRYIYLGEVFGFHSNVLGMIATPAKVTFLSYPKEIETINLRNSARVICYIPATLIHEKFELKGVISNISIGGTKFINKTFEDLHITNIPIGDDVKLYFPLFGMEGIQEFKGKIRNKSYDGKGIGLGIEFENVDSQMSDMINSYIDQVAEYEGT